jgi:hypothetical protein
MRLASVCIWTLPLGSQRFHFLNFGHVGSIMGMHRFLQWLPEHNFEFIGFIFTVVILGVSVAALIIAALARSDSQTAVRLAKEQAALSRSITPKYWERFPAMATASLHAHMPPIRALLDAPNCPGVASGKSYLQQDSPQQPVPDVATGKVVSIRTLGCAADSGLVARTNALASLPSASCHPSARMDVSSPASAKV